jgi:hypothetical protein
MQNLRSTLLLVTLLAASASAQIFSDVPSEHWAQMEAEWLASRGLIEGWDGKLHGNRNFTRYEMVEVLFRFMRKLEDHRSTYQERLALLARTDDRLEGRIDTLFETAGGQPLRTPAKMASYQARERQRRTGSTGSVERTDAGVVDRLREIHQEVSSHRRDGLEQPVLVVPPGANVWVSLPDLLMDSSPARFDEGVHVLHWGSELQVPSGASASLLMPGDRAGSLLLEGTRGVIRERGFVAAPGSPAPLPVGQSPRGD